MSDSKHIAIVTKFVDNGDHPATEFVEIEVDGKSVKVGDWVDRPDGMTELRITASDIERVTK